MLYRIQSTALGQSGNTLLILPNATITVRDANGDLARLYADPDEITEIPNPTLSDAAGGYDFYVEYGDYYDITVALNGQSVDDRVYPIDMGLGARVDAAAATATEQAEIATTKAGEANTSAVTSQAWAESDTAPGDPGTKSAKTWAGEAAGDATAAAESAAKAELFDGPKFNTIALMALYEDAKAGDVATVLSAFNGGVEHFDWIEGGSLTADGALVVDGVGGQWVSKRTVYADFAEFIGDRRTFTAGTTLTIPSIRAVYQATAGTGNLGQANAGGQQFDVLSGANGKTNLYAFGAKIDGVTDDSAAWQAAIYYQKTHRISCVQPVGETVVGTSLIVPNTNGPLGERYQFTFEGANRYDTAGPQDDVACRIKCTAPKLFVAETPGTFAVPAAVRLDFRGIGAYGATGTEICFDLLNLQYSIITECWFRNFLQVIRGKASVTTRIFRNTFLNCTKSAFDNSEITGAAKSCSDFWFRENYVSGAITTTDTILINLTYPSFGWIEDNFVDFGVIGMKLESGEAMSISGNQVDYCPTGIQLKNSNLYSMQGNRFTNIKKTQSSFWTSPTTAMVNDDWECIEILLGTKNIDIDGTIFVGPDKEIVMQQSSYSNIKERGSIRQGATPGSIVDMTGRTVGASPDGTGLDFDSYQDKDYTTLPVAPATSFPGHRIYYYGSAARLSADGVWLDAAGGRTFGRTDLTNNTDEIIATGLTLGASEALTSGRIVITGNNFTDFYKTLSETQSAGTYLVIFEFSSFTAGSIRVQNKNGGTADQSSAFGFNSTGVKYWQFTATGSFDRINFVGSNLTATMSIFRLIKLT